MGETQIEIIEVGPISRLIEPTRLGEDEAKEALLKVLRPFLEVVAQNNLDAKLRQKAGVSDVVQLAFLKVIENFEAFRGDSSGELKAWIRQIVKNEIGDLRRSYLTSKRNIGREENNAEYRAQSIVDHVLTPSSDAIREEQNARVRQALNSLAPDDSTVIQLRTFEGLPFKEISRRMARSEEAVSQLWYRAVLRFEKKYRETN